MPKDYHDFPAKMTFCAGSPPAQKVGQKRPLEGLFVQSPAKSLARKWAGGA
jgi:hypothetical protein